MNKNENKKKSKKEELSYVEQYGHFECPDCGRSTHNGDEIFDNGGFCQDCSADH